MKNGTNSCLDEVSLSEGYTSCFKFINDNSNRVIFGSGDDNVCVYDYIQKCKLLTIKQSLEDMKCIDYFIDSNLSIIDVTYIGGEINTVNCQ